jgi:hypothetical protein
MKVGGQATGSATGDQRSNFGSRRAQSRLLSLLLVTLTVLPSLAADTATDRHPFACTDYTAGKVFLVSAAGKAEWEWACRASTATPLSFGSLEADAQPRPISRTGLLGPCPRWAGVCRMMPFHPIDRLLIQWMTASGSRPHREFSTKRLEPARPARQCRRMDAHRRPGGKVVRGGSFCDRPERATAAARQSYPSWQRVFNVGFRVVCEPAAAVAIVG